MVLIMVSIISNQLAPFYINIKIRQTSKGKTKCRHHGGHSTGSRTAEGKARQIAANTKHGNETRAIREERSARLAELYPLEMLGRELGLISGKMVGLKPSKR